MKNRYRNNISFRIFPSPASNDHELRILINGDDFLGKDYLGIDPPSFFKQKNLFEPGELIIGRCTCGCEGCGDYPVAVNFIEEKVSWTNHDGLTLEFDRLDYEKTITEAKNDYSWEDINRRVERLVSEIFHNSETIYDYSFHWASARIKEGVISLSFSKKGEQKLFEFPWDKKSTESAIKNAKTFKERLL